MNWLDEALPWRNVKGWCMALALVFLCGVLGGEERRMCMELIRIRASSLPELFDCPARWEAKNLRGLHLPTSGAAQLGTAVHAGTALFDMSKIQQAGLTIDDCAGEVVDAIWQPECDIDWGESSPGEAEPIALALHRRYCEQISPRFAFSDVEAECQNLDILDIGICLTGTTDRIYQAPSGEYGIADIKTGKSAVGTDGAAKTAGHAAQVAVYELLAEQATGKPIDAPAAIIGLQVAKTEAGRRAGMGEISGAKELLTGSDGQPGLLEIAAGFLKSGVFFGNPRSSLCNPKYCPAYTICRFRR